MIPDDKLYMGQDVKVVLPLARASMTTLEKLLATPRLGRNVAGVGTYPMGTESYLDIGSLLQRNGMSFELWLVNGFYNTPNALAYPDLDIGRYFVCCNLAGFTPDRQGRDTEQAQLMIEANWVQAWPTGPRVCYSKDPAYFENLPSIG